MAIMESEQTSVVWPAPCKVLVVGAGGIGCELLKNLVLEGVKDITIVARESVLRFRPDCQIIAHHKSVLSCAFGSDFFSSFDVVFNALDNQAARRHVNRLCVTTQRPLIESGTAGYLGQVEPLLPTGWRMTKSNDEIASTGPQTLSNGDTAAGSFRTGCYECQPRGKNQRSFPACTIRNTPSEPIHCVVWAKYLFNQLFGEPDVNDEDVSPDLNDPSLQQKQLEATNQNAEPSSPSNHQDSKGGENGAPATNGTTPNHNHSNGTNGSKQTLRESFQVQWTATDADRMPSTGAIVPCKAAKDLVWRLFHRDLVTLVGMRDLWQDRQDRREPSPLDEVTVEEAIANDPESVEVAETNNSARQGALRDQRSLRPAGWLRLLMNSIGELQTRSDQNPTAPLSWDKDDKEAMDFVSSAAILRAQLFHLPGADDLTRFGIKSLAGNIIPAIATTNAIVAGLMVLQARQVIADATQRIHAVYLHRNPTGRRGNRRMVVPCKPPTPNPACFVCGTAACKSILNLICSPADLSLRVLRDRILVHHLGMLAPDVEIEGRGVILISSEEGETTDDTLSKHLTDFRISSGTFLQCDDFLQDLQLRLLITAVSREVAFESATESSTTTVDTKRSTNVTQVTMAADPVEGWRVCGRSEDALAKPSESAQSEETKNSVTVSNDVVPDTKNPMTETDPSTLSTLDALESNGSASPCPKRARIEMDKVVLDHESDDDLVMMD